MKRTVLGLLFCGLVLTSPGDADETAEALTAQARLVAEASDLAQIQLAEAQAGLAARAADLALAANGAETAAARAGDAPSPARHRADVAAMVGFGTRNTLSSATDPKRGIGAAHLFKQLYPSVNMYAICFCWHAAYAFRPGGPLVRARPARPANARRHHEAPAYTPPTK